MNNKSTNQFTNQPKTNNNKYREYIKNANLTDSFLFGQVFGDNEVFKGTIKLLLGKDVEIVGDPNIIVESSEANTKGFKSVRFDVKFKGSDNIINLEMQNIDKAKDPLPKRSGFYTAMLASKSLKSGEDYNKKIDTYVIFLCNFDPFGAEDYCYYAKYYCKGQYTKKVINDYDTGDWHYYFNLTADKKIVPPALYDFFNYIRDTVNYTPSTETDLLTKIAKCVKEVKCDRKGDYMTYLEELRDARTEGRDEGIRIFLNFLIKKGFSMKEAIEQIALEYNLSEEGIKEIINSVPQPSI